MFLRICLSFSEYDTLVERSQMVSDTLDIAIQEHHFCAIEREKSKTHRVPWNIKFSRWPRAPPNV